MTAVDYLTQEFFHGAVLSQQVVDLILAVHGCLALTGAAEVLGHLTLVVLVLLKLPPLGQLHMDKLENIKSACCTGFKQHTVQIDGCKSFVGKFELAFREGWVRAQGYCFNISFPFTRDAFLYVKLNPQQESHKAVCSSL